MGPLLAIAVAAPVLAESQSSSPTSRALVAAQGAQTFGARVKPIGQTPRAAVEALEDQLGHPLPLVSEYPAWDANFPNPYFEWLANSGHQLLLAVKLKRANGSRPSWAALANATKGSVLYAELHHWARAIRDLGAPTYFVFHKEPNEPANRPNGTAADYKAAWARVAQVFEHDGADNAQLVFAMAGGMYPSAGNTWYPGDKYVDVIAATGVNFRCSIESCTWREQEDIMRPMVTWSASHAGKTLGVVEGATVEDPNHPFRKKRWIQNAQDYLTQLGTRVAFYSYWSSYDGLDYRLTSSDAALKAGAAWASDPLWQ
ncbi:MAG TPA: hypothetical protein VFX15_09155 [Actinomycetes bacterium]|nr:hypothetical protein [Actinomycetes bacterium]